LDEPQVKHASKAKTKTTAAILEDAELMATQIASAMRTRHIPRAMEMNSLRRPTRSIVYHFYPINGYVNMERELLTVRNDAKI
jgi:hypothetical protein